MNSTVIPLKTLYAHSLEKFAKEVLHVSFDKAVPIQPVSEGPFWSYAGVSNGPKIHNVDSMTSIIGSEIP